MFIPLACAAYAKFSIKGYDNSSPREFLAKCEGRQKRANYAQNNFYETFPAFGVGVVAAHQMNVATAIIDQLAILYVAARCVFAVAYIMNRPIIRSISWFVALFAIVKLYLSGIL